MSALFKFLIYVANHNFQLVLSDDQHDLGKSVPEETSDSASQINEHTAGKMDLERIEKKLREAQFFLDKMRDQESRAVGDRDPFDFYLSACLSAARTVDYRLKHEQPTYNGWRKNWDASLSPSEAGLVKFMIDDRNVEVHESGSSRTVKTEEIKIVGDTYSDKSGTFYVSGPPGCRHQSSINLATSSR
ncbi:hypothetical protein [Bradyrhizobium erythrophlei]|nr:hypothetical protein [Bradyrhizobium erythrophlei]